jgi:hypothetical protein
MILKDYYAAEDAVQELFQTKPSEPSGVLIFDKRMGEFVEEKEKEILNGTQKTAEEES